MKHHVNLIVTDFGEYPMPPDISARYDAAKKTKSRKLDRRTREGKALSKWEREFILADRQRYMAAA
jgi:hypothetical protein